MKASFDGARMNMSASFNKVADVFNGGMMTNGLTDALRVLRQDIGAIMCMHDPNDKDDCNDLSAVILEEIK